MIDLPKNTLIDEQLPLTTNLLRTFQQGSGIKGLFYPIWNKGELPPSILR